MKRLPCLLLSAVSGLGLAAADEPTVLPELIAFADRDREAPGAYSVIDRAILERVDADHAAEILNTTPGVNIQINSGQESLIALRSPVLNGGAGQGSVLIQENGLAIRSPAFGNVNQLFETPFELASGIEVVRGPGSARTGSNAIHGVINVLTPTPGTLGSALTARASISSLNRHRLDLQTDQAVGGAGVYAGLSLTADGGWRDVTGLQQQKAVVSTAFDWGAWRGLAWVSGTNLNQETAGFLQGDDAYTDRDFAETNANPEAFRDAWSARAALRLERDLAVGTVSVTPYVRAQDMVFRQHFLPYRGLEENASQSFGVQIRVSQGQTQGWRFSYGGDLDIGTGDLVETQDLPSFGPFPQGVHYDYTVDTVFAGLWGEATWTSGAWRALLGLRGEVSDYSYETRAPVGISGRFNVVPNRSDDFSYLTPKAGLTYTGFAWGEVFATIARGARAPQATDLYRLQEFQQPGEIDVETNDQLEIGARGTKGPLDWDVAAFIARKENFFFRDANGLNVADGVTESAGIEASARWRVSERLRFAGQLTYADHTYAFDREVRNASEVIRSGNQVDTAPEWLADFGAIWTPVDAFELALQAEYIGEYATNAANTQFYPGHTVAHLRTRYRLSDSLETFATVRNLFDEAYADRADFAFGNERYFPGEPRNLTVGLRLSR